MPEPSFTYDPTVNNNYGGYRNNTTGRFESPKKVRAVFDKYLDNSEDKFKEIAIAFQDGRLSLPDWQLQMRRAILETNGNAALNVVGGREQMTFSKWGTLGNIVKREYQYLDVFAKEVAEGKQAINSQFINRCKMYGGAAETTRHIYDRQQIKGTIYDQERNILEPGAKHCNGCLAESSKGWVSIGDLELIGNRTCLKNDRCTIIYRNSETGEILQ